VKDKCAYCGEDIGDYSHYEILQDPPFPMGRLKDGLVILIHQGQKWHAYCMNWLKDGICQ